jgi:hypothetical protein
MPTFGDWIEDLRPNRSATSSTMYGDRFSREDFPEAVIEATKELMTKIWHNPRRIKREGVLEWLRVVSPIYGIDVPNFEFVGGEEGDWMYAITGGGKYRPDTHTIYLFKKYSLTTLLHEFRHAWQFRTGSTLDKEDDARAWSCSLYKVTDPERYQRAVENGILHFC